MILEAQKDAATKAAKTVTDAAGAAGGKAVEFGTTAGAKAKDYTDDARSRATEVGAAAVAAVTETVKPIFFGGKDLANKGIVVVKEFKLGDKNVGERAQLTVDTVSERIDMDQIQDQVAKLRHQMESVMGTWKESFRPGTPADEPKAAAEAATKAAPKPKAQTTKTTTRKTTTRKATTAKKAPAKTASTKTTAKKAPAKKTTTRKATPKASTTE